MPASAYGVGAVHATTVGNSIATVTVQVVTRHNKSSEEWVHVGSRFIVLPASQAPSASASRS